MLPRTLEPEVMDTPAEARDYDAMDHGEVNRIFVDDLLRAAAELPAVAAVLDVGTGTAQIPIELCRRREFTGRVVAIDLAAEMLKLAAANIRAAGLDERISLQHIDAKRLPLADGSFDVVMSNSIVHHIPEPRGVLAEIFRVVRPGGLVFVRDLERPPDLDTLNRLVTTYAGHENERARSMFRASLHAALTLNEIRTLLTDLGRPSEWVARTSDRHWTICGAATTCSP
ncbi:MAG: class I SAM-dependent methyltransferase [Planctomycetes bacterium]|nr:class I SAM-dependent methyltransferase [Planctomycetota bacterium]